MAVRLQMKLGVVAEQDRHADSPDTAVVVEPTAASVARSKGHLYLVVTSLLPGPRGHEATRLAAETIRNEYYYDESGNIEGCLSRAVATANRRLGHQRDRLGLIRAGDEGGPIGVAVAVVRGNELYVGMVGPAEAYLIRQARLSTLPDRDRDHGLPASLVELDVWRGQIQLGDAIVLISSNLVARLGLQQLKDAMITLHPQSAMEHLHHRFLVADGRGSDAAIAFEAAEATAMQARRPIPAPRPPEPEPIERTPIPLADPVTGGVAVVQAGARQARVAAEGAMGGAAGAVGRAMAVVQRALPRRGPAHRRVTPASSRRETQRRALVAVLGFVVVASSLAALVLFAPRDDGPAATGPSADPGRQAFETAQANLARVTASGEDLIESDPAEAETLLADAFRQLRTAQQGGVSADEIRPVRSEVAAGLNRLYRMVSVADLLVFDFNELTDVDPAIEGLVRGPDNAPYVLDGANDAVWRLDLEEDEATLVIEEGSVFDGEVAAAPKLLASAGQDLLILDESNVLWRWRPSDEDAQGSMTTVNINGAGSWGEDVSEIGTYIPNEDEGAYRLYVLDPSEQQILAYSPAADGQGYPAPDNWLNESRPLDGVTSMSIDGDIYLADDGDVVRFSAGRDDGWEAQPPGDEVLRRAPEFRLISSVSARRDGRVYGWDPESRRIVAWDKADGAFVEQYRLSGRNEGWTDIRDMYVVPGRGDLPSTVVWATEDQVHFSKLAPREGSAPAASPSPGGSPEASGSGAP